MTRWQAGPSRKMWAPRSELIIWHPLKPMFFHLFRPCPGWNFLRARAQTAVEFRKRFFRVCGVCVCVCVVCECVCVVCECVSVCVVCECVCVWVFVWCVCGVYVVCVCGVYVVCVCVVCVWVCVCGVWVCVVCGNLILLLHYFQGRLRALWAPFTQVTVAGYWSASSREYVASNEGFHTVDSA